MDKTPNLTMLNIMEVQAQKHVTRNEVIRVQLSVDNHILTLPLASAQESDSDIVTAYIPSRVLTSFMRSPSIKTIPGYLMHVQKRLCWETQGHKLPI